jgi:signal transduction histidine kinase
VELSVTDNGLGIRPSELPRIFDKGFVGSNGRGAGSAGATGMGLYLCAGLCQRLGIGIAAESDWNRSTSVRLYFSDTPCKEGQ